MITRKTEIVTVERFVTSDGATFDTEHEAILHENTDFMNGILKSLPIQAKLNASELVIKNIQKIVDHFIAAGVVKIPDKTKTSMEEILEKQSKVKVLRPPAKKPIPFPRQEIVDTLKEIRDTGFAVNTNITKELVARNMITVRNDAENLYRLSSGGAGYISLSKRWNGVSHQQ